MAVTPAALLSELTNDPAALGYSAAAASKPDDFARLAADLNLPRAGAAFSVFVNALAATDVQAALDPAEFATMTAAQLDQLAVMLAGGVVNAASANVRSIIVAIFSPAASFTNTRASLVAVAKRQGSRAEVLFGTGTAISGAMVAAALGK